MRPVAESHRQGLQIGKARWQVEEFHRITPVVGMSSWIGWWKIAKGAIQRSHEWVALFDGDSEVSCGVRVREEAGGHGLEALEGISEVEFLVAREDLWDEFVDEFVAEALRRESEGREVFCPRFLEGTEHIVGLQGVADTRTAGVRKVFVEQIANFAWEAIKWRVVGGGTGHGDELRTRWMLRTCDEIVWRCVGSARADTIALCARGSGGRVGQRVFAPLWAFMCSQYQSKAKRKAPRQKSRLDTTTSESAAPSRGRGSI